MPHPFGLTDEEFAAIAGLQKGQPVPPRDDPVWHSLMWMGLVWLDLSESPGRIRLTPLGRRYPEPT